MTFLWNKVCLFLYFSSFVLYYSFLTWWRLGLFQVHSVLYMLVLEMMTSVLKMTSPLGIYFVHVPSYFGHLFLNFIFWAQFVIISCRREALWPELDTLLREEGDTAVTPYTAAVLEYRVSIHNSEDALNEKNLANGNGHVVFDAQHPYRWGFFSFLIVLSY